MYWIILTTPTPFTQYIFTEYSRALCITPGSAGGSASHQSSRFYGKSVPYETPDDEDDGAWQPGDYIVPPANPQPDIQSLFANMQSSITSQIQKVQSSLDSLSSWVDRLESDMSGTREQLLNASLQFTFYRL